MDEWLIVLVETEKIFKSLKVLCFCYSYIYKEILTEFSLKDKNNNSSQLTIHNIFNLPLANHEYGLAGGSDGKESAHNGRDLGSIPGLGKGNCYPLQYFCLENSIDRGAW